MKDTLDNFKTACDVKGKSRIKALWDRQLYKIKRGSYTCPLCKESFTGLAALGAHLRDHCT